MKSYKNEWFVRELTNASAKRTLGEAAPEWQFSHFGYVNKGGNCQVCHTRIMKFVAIKNTENGILLLVGEDCYDKLQYYLATQKLEAVSLESRKQYISQIKKYCKKEINEAFLEWFSGQKEIPEAIQNTLKVIRQLGYAPSLAAAEALVEYYKDNRLFPINNLLNKNERHILAKIPSLSNLPKEIKLSWLAEIQEQILVAYLETERKREKELERELKREKKAKKYLKENFIAKGLPVQLDSPLLQNNRGEFYGGYYVIPPSLTLKFQVKNTVIEVDLPREDVKERLGQYRWSKKCEQWLEMTMPDNIRFVERGGGLVVREEDMDEWLGKASKLAGLEESSKEIILEIKEKKRQQKEAEDRQRSIDELDTKVANSPERYSKISFYRGVNPKYGTSQWESWKKGITYVLHRDAAYKEDEGTIYVEILRELVPGRIILVGRI